MSMGPRWLRLVLSIDLGRRIFTPYGMVPYSNRYHNRSGRRSQSQAPASRQPPAVHPTQRPRLHHTT
jgi:hypothetical protein